MKLAKLALEAITRLSVACVASGHRLQCDRSSTALLIAAQVLVLSSLLLPEIAQAQAVGGPFGGITDFLKSLVTMLIFDWGYYLGIAALAIQGFRCWTGRIDMMDLGVSVLGIGLVFFAPNIVADLRARSSGTI